MKNPRKISQKPEHRLADLVRYLAKRAAERDYASLQSAKAPKSSPRKSAGRPQ